MNNLKLRVTWANGKKDDDDGGDGDEEWHSSAEAGSLYGDGQFHSFLGPGLAWLIRRHHHYGFGHWDRKHGEIAKM